VDLVESGDDESSGRHQEASISQESLEERMREKIRREQIRKNQAAIPLLDFWSELGDEREQSESLHWLKEKIDSDRPGPRNHFSRAPRPSCWIPAPSAW